MKKFLKFQEMAYMVRLFRALTNQRTLVFTLLAVPGMLQSASNVNFSASIGQKPLIGADGSSAPNGTAILMGTIDQIPQGTSDFAILSGLESNFRTVAVTTTKSLPGPEFPPQGLFAASASFEQADLTGGRIFWLVLRHEKPWSGQINLLEVTEFGLFSSSLANWQFPDPDQPAPGNTTTIISDEVDIAHFGTLTESGLQLQTADIAALYPIPVPEGFTKLPLTIPTSSEALTTAIWAYQKNGTLSSQLLSLTNPGIGHPALALMFSQATDRVITTFFPIQLPSPDTIYRVGMEVSFLLPDNLASIDPLPLTVQFQGITENDFSSIRTDGFLDIPVIPVPSSLVELNLPPANTLINGRSSLQGTLRSNSAGMSWAAIQWTLDAGSQANINVSDICLVIKPSQTAPRITGFSPGSQGVILTFEAEPGLEVFVDSSVDLNEWDELISTRPTERVSSLLFPTSALPPEIFLRIRQSLRP